jgi:hypothetical protein
VAFRRQRDGLGVGGEVAHATVDGRSTSAYLTTIWICNPMRQSLSGNRNDECLKGMSICRAILLLRSQWTVVPANA